MNQIFKLSVILIFVIGPISDTFGGLTNDYVPISLLTRLIILSISFPIIISCRRIYEKLFPLVFTVFAYILIVTFLQLLISDTLEYSVSAISNAIKLLYFPVLMIVIITLHKKRIITNRTINNGILLTGILLITSILFGKFSGFGGEIAGRGSEISGNKGFLIGANEVGLMLLLTAPAVIRLMGTSIVFNKFDNLLALIIYGAAGLFVFTKSSLASTFIPIASWLTSNNKRRTTAALYFFVKLIFCLLGLSLIFAIYYYEIEEILGKTFFASLFDGALIDFIFRGRSSYYDAITPGLIDNGYNFLIILFGAGEGYIRSLSMAPLGRTVSEATMFEMDGLDLFWSYGVVGVGLYLASVYYSIKFAKLTRPNILNTIAIGLALMHSILAGHVIFSPQVTTLITFILMANLRQIDHIPSKHQQPHP